jgi:hypothetical protein
MFSNELKKYRLNDSFNFNYSELLAKKCNAPHDKAGIYLIFKIVDEQEILIYIGSSGQRKKDGTLKVRKGGIYDRLVNGYHPNKFGETKRIKRHKAFPKQMLNEGIKEIKIYWWVTYHNENLDFPTDVETTLREIYCNEFFKLPDWHK